MARLSDPITILKGIGPARAKQFENLNIFTLEDLICHFCACSGETYYLQARRDSLLRILTRWLFVGSNSGSSFSSIGY